MQERYIGDQHDLIKYTVLNRIWEMTDLTVGVNWYLTDPKMLGEDAQANHGERRKLYSKKRRWADAELVRKLEKYSEPQMRQIQNIMRDDVLPKTTIYQDEPVPAKGRLDWHFRSMDRLRKARLVFLDPDIGFLVGSASISQYPKYAFYREFVDYLRNDQSVISIQFTRQQKAHARTYKARRELECLNGETHVLPALRVSDLEFIGVSNGCDHGPLQRAFQEIDALINGAGSVRAETQDRRR
jgi:hypothetical protein